MYHKSDKRQKQPRPSVPRSSKKRADTKRTYKDTVFQMLFSDKEKLLELFNALEGTAYEDPSKIEIETLESAIFNRVINDLAFRVGYVYILLLEHQSQENANIPLRMLLYLTREYEKVLDLDGVHRQRQMEIPTPHLYMIYNGARPYRGPATLRLSEAYAEKTGRPMVEVEVRVIDVNDDKNASILKQCSPLREYSQFVKKVQKRLAEGLGRDSAIRLSIEECVNEGILEDFLRKHGEEVASSMFREYTVDDVIRIRSEEAMEIGLEQGIEKGIEQGIEQGIEKGIEQGIALGKEQKAKETAISLKAEGVDEAIIVRATGLSPEVVRGL